MNINFLSKLVQKFNNNNSIHHNLQSYITHLACPSWSGRDFSCFVEEGYKKNIIANRCVSLIATSAASVDWLLYFKSKTNKQIIKQHKLLELLRETVFIIKYYQNKYLSISFIKILLLYNK